MAEPSKNNSISISGNASGSVIITGDDNTVNVTLQSVEHLVKEPASKGSSEVGPNPYKGLAAFKESDEAFYFGRETQVARLWQRFQDLHEQSKVPRILPIVGPSGCGKSSLARAGFIPEIGRRPLPGKDRMNVVTLMPGKSPLRALANILAKAITSDPLPLSKSEELEQLLEKVDSAGNYEGLLQIASLISDIRDNPLVILIDQFEEIYSLCDDARQRQSFVGNLLCAASSSIGDVSVVIVLRSDFVGETQQHEQLSQIIGSDQSMIVPAMTEAELRLAIAKPAEQAGQAFHPAMVDLLISDTKESEGVLPLLQFALTRLWEGIIEGNSPSNTYKEMGHVGGALAGKAQKIYDTLTDSEKEIARRVFLGLVQVGEGSRNTRRRASVTSLMANQDSPKAVTQVIQRFSSLGTRLITLSSFEGKQIAEVTHEALFEHWQQLNGWIENNRDDLRFQRRLDSAASRWSEQNRPAGLLWRQPELDSLHKYHQRRGQDMSALSLSFYQASVRYENRQRLTRWSGVGLLSILTVGTTWFGLQSRKAEQRALAGQTAIQAEALLDQTDETQREAGALLSVRALETADEWKIGPWKSGTLEIQSVNQALRHSLTVLSGNDGIITQNHHERVNAVAFSPDSGRIVTATEDGIAKLWNSRNGKIIATLSHDSKDVNTAVFSPDGQFIATGGKDGRVRLWEGDNGKALAVFEHIGMVFAVAFSPDGTQLVAGTGDGTTRLWEVASGKNITTFRDGDRSHLVAFSRDGKSVMTGGQVGAIRLWDAASGKELTAPNYGRISDIDFSSDGNSIVTASDSIVRLQDAASGKILLTINHEDRVESVAFSPNNQYIATASMDGTARAWQINNGENIATFAHKKGASAVAFSPDGKRIVTAGHNGDTRVHWLWSRDLAKKVCLQLNRNLTADEWTRYIQTALTEYDLICSNRAVHASVIEAAKTKAENGEIKDAIAIFNRAIKISKDSAQNLDIDPSTAKLDRDSKEVAQRFFSIALAEEARLRVREGDTAGAKELLSEAISVSPSIDLNIQTEELDQDPEQVTTNLVALGTLENAYLTARNGSLEESILLFNRALALNPAIDFNPRTDELDQSPEKAAREIAALERVEEARQIAEEGNVKKATDLLIEALSLNPMVDLKADTEEIEQNPEAVATLIAAIAEQEDTVTITARSTVFSGW